MASSSLHSPAVRRCVPSTNALRLSDVPHPATAASYSDKGGLISERTILASGILRLPPEIHLIIVQYLSRKSIYAMILMLSCPIIRRMSTSERTLAVYVWKAGKLGKCGKLLMRMLALPEYPPHALSLIADVCPTAELTNQSDDACWPLCVPDERSAEAVPFAENNTTWLLGLFGDHLTTLKLARLFPHMAPEIFSNPINMAAAIGDAAALQTLLDKLGGSAVWTHSPNFGFSQQSTHTYAWSDLQELTGTDGPWAFSRSNGERAKKLEIHGPLEWAAVYGQHETFAVLVAWFRKNSPEKLFKIFSSNSMTSLLHCAVYYLHHPGSGLRMREALKVIKAVTGLLPDDIRYKSPSPLFLALQTVNPGVALIEALLSIPGGCEAHRDHWMYEKFHLRPAVFNAILDAEPSGKSILLPHLMTKLKTFELLEGDWINFKAALQRAPQAAKYAAVKEFLSRVPPLGTGWWEITDNPLIALKINGCRFDHQPLSGSDFSAQQYLLHYNHINKPAVAVLLKWLVNETGLDCAPFVPRVLETNNPLYPGLPSTVRGFAIQSGYDSLYSIVLDIPHVPLPDAVPDAACAIFPKLCTYQGSPGYIAMFLRYPGDVADVFQWVSAMAAVHDTIPLQWRFGSASEFICSVDRKMVRAMRWICENREDGTEEMREAGRRLEEWLRRAEAAGEQIPDLLHARIVDICQWVNRL